MTTKIVCHNDRLRWLSKRNFLAEVRSCTLPELGLCVWIDGYKGMRPVSLWLSARDGTAILHGSNDKEMTWPELQEWIEPTEKPVKKAPVQKSLWGDMP